MLTSQLSGVAVHPDVEALVQLVPPQQEAVPRDWPAVHSRLGHELPEDYRQLVDTYGGGLFDEAIWILEPDCEDKEYDLFAMVQERAEVLERLWEGDRGEPECHQHFCLDAIRPVQGRPPTVSP